MFRFRTASPTHYSLHQFDDSTVDGLDHFYSFESAEFRKRVPVISMAEFIELEAKQKGLVNLDPKDYGRVLQLSLSCENRRLSEWTEVQYNFLNAVCFASNTHL